jgi:hypothetical protein
MTTGAPLTVAMIRIHSSDLFLFIVSNRGRRRRLHEHFKEPAVPKSGLRNFEGNHDVRHRFGQIIGEGGKVASCGRLPPYRGLNPASASFRCTSQTADQATSCSVRPL